MAADGVGAIMRAVAIPLEALINIQASGIIGVQIMSFVTGAHVTAQQVHAVVSAIVATGQALVHIHAVLPIVRHQNIAGRALAMITALGVHAGVRTTGLHVVLELLALVDVLAGPMIAFQTEAERAGATNTRNPIGIIYSMTMVGTISIVALAAVHQDASFIVQL